ncbi:MAG: hypothetical protein ACI9NC_001624, partial [Verrucomicrobiales bacterium]
MREKHQPRTNRVTSNLVGALTLLMMLGIAGAADDHLPAKARSVAAKFESYKKTAQPSAVETKRKQVIAYLGTILNEEASDADLDGAIAVKALMERINNETIGKGTSRVSPKLTKKPEGLPRRSFSINSEKNRRLEFQFHVERDLCLKTLRCEISGAAGDIGDQGLEYELIDPRGKVVKKGKLKSADQDLIVHPAKTGGTWKIAL